ncbi:L,D-transpeptidase [Halobacteriovorax sp.]|uniref:L,D-transpeptidase n=1 Tax=Halobacteriovorax sp. TaxID=2020862 RepID=UPI003568CFA8
MLKQFKLAATALALFSISNGATAFFSDYRFGFRPKWVKQCERAQEKMEGHLLGALNKCNSKGYMGYKDDLAYYSVQNDDATYSFNRINSVHVVVTDAKQDREAPDYGSCKSEMCYRAYVYINGDQYTGDHVATWVTTPGRRWYDGSGGDYTPESKYVYQTTPMKNQNELGHFLLQKDGEMGLGGDVTDRVTGYFVMDHYRNSDNEDMPWATFYHLGVGFHSSKYVDGTAGSHGCTRLKHIEAKKMNFLARHVKRKFTVETRYTERQRLSTKARQKVSKRQ